MERVGDVVGPARERFGMGPAEAMPRGVEQRDRHAPVDRRRAREIGGKVKAILPRAGEERQRESTRRRRGKQRAREVVRILADTARLAQRGSVVKQYAKWTGGVH